VTTISQGNEHDFNVVVKDAAGAAIDLTGFGISFAVAPHVNATALFTKTVGSGIAITDAAAGKFTVTLSDTDTDLRGRYYYECKTTDLAGNDATLLTGHIVFGATLL